MQSFYFTEPLIAAEQEEITRYPALSLMKQAATYVAEETIAFLESINARDAKILLLVGGGGNGGDALFTGARLMTYGLIVTAVEFHPTSTHPEAKDAFIETGGTFLDPAQIINQLSMYTLAIDGICGLHGTVGLRNPADSIVQQLRCPIIAIDIPSGVDPNTGNSAGTAVSAIKTITFGAKKTAHILGYTHCGAVSLLHFSNEYTQSLPSPDIISFGVNDMNMWPVPLPDDDKYSDGVVGIIAGSQEYPGAAVLACGGALAATSSMVRYAGAASVHVLSWWPEVVVSENIAETGRVNCWAIGSGGGKQVHEHLTYLQSVGMPMVIDAAALDALGQDPALRDNLCANNNVIMTPHLGEYQRLTGIDLHDANLYDRVQSVTETAEKFGCTILLKGKGTVIVDPQHGTAVQIAPSSWAATPGSGDVLTGIIGALFASGLSPLQAAGLGSWAHAQAAKTASMAEEVPDFADLIGNPAHIPGAPIRSSQIIHALSAVIRQARLKCYGLTKI